MHDNSFGILGVLCGILSILFAPGPIALFVYGPFAGIALGVLGLVFGLLQRKRSPSKFSRAAIILSVVGIVVNIVAIVLLIKALQELAELAQTLQTGDLGTIS